MIFSFENKRVVSERKSTANAAAHTAATIRYIGAGGLPPMMSVDSAY